VLTFLFQSKKSTFGLNIVKGKYNFGDLKKYEKLTFPYMTGMKQPEASYSLLTVVCFCNPPVVCVKVLVATEG
jgi:hypothetical protein